MEDGSESSPDFLSVETALNDVKADWPEEIELVELPVTKPDTRLYVLKLHLYRMAFCGAAGQCPLQLIEEDESGVRCVAETDGVGVSIYLRPGSAFPDVFTYQHMSASEGSISGYVNLAGVWGQLYCGDENVRVCQ
ncbi:MAG: hypothetical protein ACYC92_04955 [Candidatus Acidiferrales bacterium]